MKTTLNKYSVVLRVVYIGAVPGEIRQLQIALLLSVTIVSSGNILFKNSK